MLATSYERSTASMHATGLCLNPDMSFLVMWHASHFILMELCITYLHTQRCHESQV